MLGQGQSWRRGNGLGGEVSKMVGKLILEASPDDSFSEFVG